MATNKVSIKFDIDNKDLEIVSGKVLTLQQQIRILKQEIQKPGYSPAELDLLKKKLGDTEDAFKATKARSGDLITSLQLIPGPIGEIASKVNGAISLFKQFGSFKLSDLKFQLKETIDDIKDVSSSILKASGAQKIWAATTTALSQTFIGLGASQRAAAVASRALAAAIAATGIGLLVVGLSMAVSKLMDFASNTKKAETANDLFTESLKRTSQALTDTIQNIKDEGEIRLLEAKKRGASEKEQQAIRVQNLKEEISALEKSLTDKGELAKKEFQILSDLDLKEEDRQKQLESLTEQRNANNRALINARIALKKLELQGDIDANARQEQLSAKNAADAAIATKEAEGLAEKQKKQRDQRLADIKAIGDAAVASIAQQKKEEENQLQARKDFGKRIRDLYVELITDEGQRRKAEIKNAQAHELEALEKDKSFIELSEEEKGRIRYAIRQKYTNQFEALKKEEGKKEAEEDQKNAETRLRILEMQGSVLLQGTKAYYNNRREIIDEIERVELEKLEKKYQDGLISEAEYEAKKTQITKEATLSREQIRQQEIESLGKIISEYLRAFGDIASAIAAGYDEEAKTSKAAFEKRKKFQIAASIANAAAGIVGVLTAKPLEGVPWPVDAVLKGLRVVALGIQTKNQIDKIRSVQFEGGGEAPAAQGYKVTANRAQGGIISGPGTSTSDSIPAMLSNGEYVVNARATSAFLPMLSAINDYGRRPRFQMGGLVQPRDPAMSLTENLDRVLQTGMDRPVKTYVVSQEMSTQQQFDRQIKSRSQM